MKDRKNPKPRLLVINACGECRHSMDRDICTHPEVPGRDIELGWGDPPIRGRSLPEVEKRYGAFKSNAPPPDWCPLPAKETT